MAHRVPLQPIVHLPARPLLARRPPARPAAAAMPAGTVTVLSASPSGVSLPVGSGVLPPPSFPPHSHSPLLARPYPAATNGHAPYHDMPANGTPSAPTNGHAHTYQQYIAAGHSHQETNGRAPNGARPNPARVLLLLDCQVSRLADPPLGVPSARAVGANIAQVLAAARACPAPARPRIIHVRKCGAPGDPDERGLPGWALVHEPLPDEPVLDKRKNNAFTGTALADLVPPDAELVVVGLESDFCVRATCSAALARGNDVLLIRGAHATYDRIEYWDGGTSTPAEKVQREIEEELEEAGVVLLEMSDLRSLYGDR